MLLSIARRLLENDPEIQAGDLAIVTPYSGQVLSKLLNY